MKVILFGATGMVGAGVLRECLRDDRITEVVSVVRTGTGTSHRKLREVVRSDFVTAVAKRFASAAPFVAFLCGALDLEF